MNEHIASEVWIAPYGTTTPPPNPEWVRLTATNEVNRLREEIAEADAQMADARLWARRLAQVDSLRRLHLNEATGQVFWKSYDNRGAVRWLEVPEWLRDVL